MIVHKEKVEVVDKSKYMCDICDEPHFGIIFCGGDRHFKIDKLPKSVWSDFESGKEYWIELKEAHSG